MAFQNQPISWCQRRPQTDDSGIVHWAVKSPDTTVGSSSSMGDLGNYSVEGANRNKIYAATFGDHLFRTYFYRNGESHGLPASSLEPLLIEISRSEYLHTYTKTNEQF